MNTLIAAECRHLQAYLQLLSDKLEQFCLLENDLPQGLRNDARHDQVLSETSRYASRACTTIARDLSETVDSEDKFRTMKSIAQMKHDAKLRIG